MDCGRSSPGSKLYLIGNDMSFVKKFLFFLYRVYVKNSNRRSVKRLFWKTVNEVYKRLPVRVSLGNSIWTLTSVYTFRLLVLCYVLLVETLLMRVSLKKFCYKSFLHKKFFLYVCKLC